jgi:hypothetical protein
MSMTLRRNANPEQAATDGQPPEAETQMRRALGLLPSGGLSPQLGTPHAGGPRSRQRAGDGPVVEHRGDRQAGSPVNRVAAAEAALDAERQAREQLSRQLRDAEAALREAQTKRGHAELARDEAVAALAAERGARLAAEEQVRLLSAATETPATPAVSAANSRMTPRRAAVPHDPAAQPKRRGRPPGSGTKTPRPVAKTPEPELDDSGAVEWWVPGWKERI